MSGGRDEGRRDGAPRELNDEELLDSLYGERTRRALAGDGDGDGERERDGDGERDDALEGELRQLRQLRGMFAELKADQEEPPPQGMALLMAAARQAADERKAAKQVAPAGLWAQLRAGWQAMVAHPGMAAAAAAVVVVGASGYLMSRGVRTAESTYTSDSAVESRSAPTAAAPVPDETSRSSAAAPAPDPAAPVAAPADPAALRGATTAAPGAAAGASSAPGAERGRSGSLGGAAAGDDLQQAQRPMRVKTPISPPREEPVEGKGGGASGRAADAPANTRRDFAKQQGESDKAGNNAPTAAPATPAPPPPPPPAQAAEAPSTSDEEAESSAGADDDSADSAVESKPRKVESMSNQVERWYSLAREAAARNDCNAVQVLAKRVLAESPTFYNSRFSKDATLKKCL
jgi:hypothetical protein